MIGPQLNMDESKLEERYLKSVANHLANRKYIKLKEEYTEKDVLNELIGIKKKYGPMLKAEWWPSTTRKAKFIPVKRHRLKASKMFGHPWFNKGEYWPKCNECGISLYLDIQLNLDDISRETGENFGKGLFQQFLCPKCFVYGDHEDYPVRNDVCRSLSNRKSANVLPVFMRLISPDSKPELFQIPDEWKKNIWQPDLDRMVSSRMLGGYKFSHYEPPSSIDFKYLGRSSYNRNRSVYAEDLLAKYFVDALEPDFDVTDGVCQALIDVIYKVYEEFLPKKRLYKRHRAAIGGWPHWVQDPDYPECPDCNDKMRILTVSDGGSAIYRIFQCSRHLSNFVWSYDR